MDLLESREKSRAPRIMGILNLSPDSFYPGSRASLREMDLLLEKALGMESQGAEYLDLGAESTRPGSNYVDAEVEIARLLPALRHIRPHIRIPISIDTRKAATAKACLAAGANIINDISALEDDSQLPRICREYHAPVVLMHKQGSPLEMQQNPRYENCSSEVIAYLKGRGAWALDQGLEVLAIDPGIGFGKNLEHNLQILQNLGAIQKECGFPLLLGASRKGLVGTVLARQPGMALPVDQRLAGSLAIVAWAWMQEVAIVRVHDVAETHDVLKMLDAIRGSERDV